MSSSDVDLHVQYRIANAPMLEFPYPHIYVRDIFPQDFYARLRANLPSEAHLRTLRSMGRVADDYLAAMRAVWTQPKPSYKGPHVSFDGVQAMPRPVQNPIPIVVGGRTPPAYRRAVTQGHGWYGFGLDVAATTTSVAALREAQKTSPRPAALGRLEISITPRGFDVPDKATIDAYAAAGVDRLILRPRPDMSVSALVRFAAETGRALGPCLT